MEISKKATKIYVWPSTLNGKEDLPFELVEWLRERNLSVRQSKDLLLVTKDLIEEAWRTEEDRTII